MDITKTMLRAIINGQSALKEELLKEIKALDKKFSNKFEGLDKKIDGVEKNLSERINKIGKTVAYLEDDTPTREEYTLL